MAGATAAGGCYATAMKRFDLRLPDDLHERLVVLAERERRSLHAQILRLLEEGLGRVETTAGRVASSNSPGA